MIDNAKGSGDLDSDSSFIPDPNLKQIFRLSPQALSEAIQSKDPILKHATYSAWQFLCGRDFNYAPWPQENCSELYYHLYIYHRRKTAGDIQAALDYGLYHAYHDKVHDYLEQKQYAKATEYAIKATNIYPAPGYLLLCKISVEQEFILESLVYQQAVLYIKKEYPKFHRNCFANIGFQDNEINDIIKRFGEKISLLAKMPWRDFLEKNTDPILEKLNHIIDQLNHDKFIKMEKSTPGVQFTMQQKTSSEVQEPLRKKRKLEASSSSSGDPSSVVNACTDDRVTPYSP